MNQLEFFKNLILSIHFPLTREDGQYRNPVFQRSSFNPLPSHEGRPGVYTGYHCLRAFNPLPSHEGRPSQEFPFRSHRIFQSTSLSRGKTHPKFRFHFVVIFQSTSLSRGKTGYSCVHRGNPSLSIHFPLTREDRRDRYCVSYD
mgnify:CR=1 FL=1